MPVAHTEATADAPHPESRGCRIADLQQRIRDLRLAQQSILGVIGDRSPQEFWELFGRHRDAIYHHLLRQVKNVHDAEDMLDQTMLHALAKFSQLQSDKAFYRWMCTIATRQCINTRKSGRLRIFGSEALLKEQESMETNPLMYAQDREKATILHDRLQALKPLDRATLDSFYFRRYSIKEMSAEFDVPQGTIKRRLHVARRRLQAKFPREK